MLMHHLFIRSAKANSRNIAFIDRAAQRTISYRQALIGSITLAKKFSRYRDRHIGVMLPTSAGCGLTVLGLSMSGKIPVMINYATGAIANVEFAQQKCQFTTVVTARALLQKIECPHVPGMVYLEDIMEQVSMPTKAKAAALSVLPAALLCRRFNRGRPQDTAVILFTSGSEKHPKAVQLTHNNLRTNVIATHRLIQANHKVRTTLAILPYFHVFGLTVCLWLPLYGGQTLITYPSPLEYKTVIDIIKEEKPEFMAATPAFYQGYLKVAAPGDLTSLALCIVGADRTPNGLRDAYRENHDIVLYEGYGATETSPVISVNLPNANRPGSVGKVLAGVDVKIVGIDTGKPVTTGEQGKILVKGDSVMKGYYRDPQETDAKIVDGWYDTGDIGLLDDSGFLWHKGRLRRFVKIGGEMISLTMVESQLGKILPADVEYCVVALADENKGAAIAVAITKNIDQQAAKKALIKQIPAIAVPKTFIVLDELPKMSSGKIDFRTATQQVEESLSHL